MLDVLRTASPQGLHETKPLLTAALLAGFDTSANDLAQLSARLFGSAEAAEGMAAFLRKDGPPGPLTTGPGFVIISSLALAGEAGASAPSVVDRDSAAPGDPVHPLRARPRMPKVAILTRVGHRERW